MERSLEGGWNQLTGPHSSKILQAFQREPQKKWVALYGNTGAFLRLQKRSKQYLV